MAVCLIVAEVGPEPFAQHAVGRCLVGRHVGEHLRPLAALVGVGAEDAGGFGAVAQQLLDDGHVHGGVDADLPAVLGGVVFGRVGWHDDVSAVGSAHEVVFPEGQGLFHEWVGAVAQKERVGREEVVVVEVAGGPAGARVPVAQAPRLVEVVVVAVVAGVAGHVYAAGAVELPCVDAVVLHQPLVVVEVGVHQLVHVAVEQVGNHHGQVAVVREVGRPGRSPRAAPDALQVGRIGAGGAQHVVARGLELPLHYAGRRGAARPEHQRFRRHVALFVGGVEAEAAPVVELGVDGAVLGQQVGVGSLRCGVCGAAQGVDVGLCLVVERLNADDHRHLFGIGHHHGAALGPEAASALRHTGHAFVAGGRAFVRLAVEGAVGQRAVGAGGGGEFGESFVHLAPQLPAVRVALQFECGVDAPLAPHADHHHVAAARCEDRARVHSLRILPVHGVLAGLVVGQALIAHYVARLRLYVEVGGRHVSVGPALLAQPGLAPLVDVVSCGLFPLAVVA